MSLDEAINGAGSFGVSDVTELEAIKEELRSRGYECEERLRIWKEGESSYD